jgi:hypothetical protein
MARGRYTRKGLAIVDNADWKRKHRACSETYPQNSNDRVYRSAEMLIPVAASGMIVPSICEKVDENKKKDTLTRNINAPLSLSWSVAIAFLYIPSG